MIFRLREVGFVNVHFEIDYIACVKCQGVMEVIGEGLLSIIEVLLTIVLRKTTRRTWRCLQFLGFF